MIPLPALRSHTIMALALASCLVAAACGSMTDEVDGSAQLSESTSAPAITTAEPEPAVDPTTTTASGVETESGQSTSVLAGVEAAQWADNVTITIGDGVFRYQSDGLPSHELPDQMLVPTGEPGDADATFVVADNPVEESPLDLEIPLNPVYSEEVTPTDLGDVGVTISGIPLFNDYEDMERTLVAIDDNIEIDGVYFLDACNGHGGRYHYHGIPVCVTDAIDIAGQHSTILGFVRDGFPFYGDKNVDGTSMTNADLDECGGHVGPTPEFPEGIYHYHLTGDSAPYSIDCYHGVIDTSGDGPPAGGAAGPPQGDAAGPPADGQGRPEGDDVAAPVGGQGPGGQGGPDLATAASTLGVTVDELQNALGGPPPDFEAAAATLGISVEELTAAVGAP